MLPVNNQEYQKAKRKGYPFGYARWAEYCNSLNSELLNKESLISPKVYFNDIGVMKNVTGIIDPTKAPDAPAIDEDAQKELAVLGIIKARVASGGAQQQQGANPMNQAVFALLVIMAIFGLTYVYGYFESRKAIAA